MQTLQRLMRNSQFTIVVRISIVFSTTWKATKKMRMSIFHRNQGEFTRTFLDIPMGLHRWPEIRHRFCLMTVVKVQGKTKKSFRHYVARIISTYDDGGYEVIFYKKLPGAYKFTETNEESFIEMDDIVFKLSKPTGINSARFHNAISFSDDLTIFTIF